MFHIPFLDILKMSKNEKSFRDLRKMMNLQHGDHKLSFFQKKMKKMRPYFFSLFLDASKMSKKCPKNVQKSSTFVNIFVNKKVAKKRDCEHYALVDKMCFARFCEHKIVC